MSVKDSKRQLTGMIFILLVVLVTFVLTQIYFPRSLYKNIIDHKLITWTRDWNNHTANYSGSELAFAIKKTHKISIRVKAPNPEPNQEIQVSLEGKKYSLSSPDINKKEISIYLDEQSYNIPQDVKIQYFCVYDNNPCNLAIESIDVDVTAKVYKSIIIPKKSLAILGDSISSNFGSQNYSFNLTDKLNRQLHNASIFGSTISSNKNSGLERYKKDVISYQPDDVLIFLGINDLLEEKSVAGFTSEYKKIIEDIKKNTRSKVFISGILQNDAVDPNIVSTYNESLESLAESEGVNYVSTANWLTSEDFMDNLHPNLAAQEKLAENFRKAIEPMIK